MASLSLNEYTATVKVDDQINSNNQLSWSFTLIKGDIQCSISDTIAVNQNLNRNLSARDVNSILKINTVDTGLYIRININIELTMQTLGVDRKSSTSTSILVSKLGPRVEKNTSVDPPALAPAAAACLPPKVLTIRRESPSINNPEKSAYADAIHNLLKKVDTAVDRSSKIAASIELFNYVRTKALLFTASYLQFRDTVIDKCWEFKITAFDSPELMEEVGNLLVALGSYSCPKEYIDDYSRLQILKDLFKKEKLTITTKTLKHFKNWCIHHPNLIENLNRYQKIKLFIHLCRHMYQPLVQIGCGLKMCQC
jgi:hypothetical protein